MRPWRGPGGTEPLRPFGGLECHLGQRRHFGSGIGQVVDPLRQALAGTTKELTHRGIRRQASLVQFNEQPIKGTAHACNGLDACHPRTAAQGMQGAQHAGLWAQISIWAGIGKELFQGSQVPSGLGHEDVEKLRVSLGGLARR